MRNWVRKTLLLLFGGAAGEAPRTDVGGAWDQRLDRIPQTRYWPAYGAEGLAGDGHARRLAERRYTAAGIFTEHVLGRAYVAQDTRSVHVTLFAVGATRDAVLGAAGVQEHAAALLRDVVAHGVVNRLTLDGRAAWLIDTPSDDEDLLALAD